MEIYGMTGERLGSIGQITTSTTGDKSRRASEIPRWKKDFLSKPSISIRKGIARGFQPAYEDTDTLVLTAPSGKFVDVRLPKSASSPDEVVGHASFWAFSGRSQTTFYDGDGGALAVSLPYAAHCVWTHDIDSKGPDIKDEADMAVLPNGDCLEIGIDVNPVTGNVEMFKEYWTDPTASSSTGALVSQVDSKTYAVAETSNLGSDSGHGIIVRIGNYCQGIFEMAGPQRGRRLLLERWLLVRDNEAVDGLEASKWQPDPRNVTSDTEDLPCKWVCAGTRSVGDEIMVGESRWHVTEAVS